MTTLRTRFLKRTKSLPGRIIVTVLDGPHQGYREAYSHKAISKGGDTHRVAAEKLARLLKIAGKLEEVDYRNSGSTFKVKDA